MEDIDRNKLLYKKDRKDEYETYEEIKRKYWENRRKYLRAKWLNSKEKLIRTRLFKKEYEKYPFSRLEINGKKIFKDVDEFLEVDIEKFCKRIHEYSYNKIHLDLDKLKYRYIYSFNSFDGVTGVDYYEIEYLKAMRQ